MRTLIGFIVWTKADEWRCYVTSMRSAPHNPADFFFKELRMNSGLNTSWIVSSFQPGTILSTWTDCKRKKKLLRRARLSDAKSCLRSVHDSFLLSFKVHVSPRLLLITVQTHSCSFLPFGPPSKKPFCLDFRVCNLSLISNLTSIWFPVSNISPHQKSILKNPLCNHL